MALGLSLFLLHVFLCSAVPTCVMCATRVNVTVSPGQVVTGVEEEHVLPDGTPSSTPLWSFKGIPYARPPVGELRFAKPREAPPFSSPLDASRYGPACPQRRASGNMSEDCLHLNIFVPRPSSAETTFPVMVWVHGGAFLSGEGRQLPAETLASFGEVIVVTFNFRIGALGFLSTDDQEAPGNWGLWDQSLALRWVRANIARFHGDPRNVALAGTTTGAFAVTYHALRPSNRGLFRRIVAESGTALSVGGYLRSGLKYAAALAEELGCRVPGSSDPTPSRTLVACLREKDAESIASAGVRAGEPFVLAWAPVLDGDYIAEDPSRVLSRPGSQGHLHDGLGAVDALFGTTSSDGSVMFSVWVQAMAAAVNESVATGVSRGFFEKVVEAFVGWSLGSSRSPEDVWMVSQAVNQEYRRTWGDSLEEDEQEEEEAVFRARELVEMFTDRGFFVPSLTFALNHASLASNRSTATFMYEFHQGSPAPDPYPWMTGSLHKDHDLYVFGMPEGLSGGAGVDVGTEEGASGWRFSKRVMTYWSNFAKTGNPNSPEPVPVEWPPFTPGREGYLHLEAGGIAARRRCRAGRASFWMDFVPKMAAFAEKQRASCKGDGGNSSSRGGFLLRDTVAKDCRLIVLASVALFVVERLCFVV